MAIPIAPIALPGLSQLSAIPKPETENNSGFGQFLHNAIQNVENGSAAADAATQNFISNSSNELHTTVLAAQSSELNLELFMQVRNKVISAYEDIMRMQI